MPDCCKRALCALTTRIKFELGLHEGAIHAWPPSHLIAKSIGRSIDQSLQRELDKQDERDEQAREVLR